MRENEAIESVKIPKRISTALVNSLSAGVVPRIGLEYVAVGRVNEIESILRDLGNVGEGGAAFKLIVGRYGSGKSFLLQTIRNYAMDRKFVVADADLSPERRLVGARNEGLATYRELMSNLSVSTRPDGGALELILQKWLSLRQQQVMQAKGFLPGDEALARETEAAIFQDIQKMQSLMHGLDFAQVLLSYWRGCKQLADEAQKQAALRYLRGEFATRTEAKNALGVSAIIDDNNWYDYIKIWAEFATQIGYQGLLLFIDEGVNLYKIPNSVSRSKNYERLLSIFNDTMQGKAAHLGVFFCDTPQAVDDERRGLFSYEALRSRLQDSRFGGALRHFTGPVIRLDVLGNEEMFVLLQKLRMIHAAHFDYRPQLTDEQLQIFMRSVAGRMGADQLLTPRELTRSFLALLSTLFENPEAQFSDVLDSQAAVAASKAALDAEWDLPPVGGFEAAMENGENSTIDSVSTSKSSHNAIDDFLMGSEL